MDWNSQRQNVSETFHPSQANSIPQTFESTGEWMIELRRLYGKGAANTLELARAVAAFKRSVPYGEWGQLWEAKEEGIPFSLSDADRLAVIGEKLSHIDSATSLKLPWGWTILHQLALLEQSTFDQLLREGRIHARLKYREAKELVAQFRGQCPDKSPKLNVKRRLRNFREFVESTLSDWSANDRELAKTVLTEISEQIGALESIPAAEVVTKEVQDFCFFTHSSESCSFCQ